MCMYMHVCMYVCMYMHVCMHVCMYVCTYLCTYTVYMYARMHVCMSGDILVAEYRVLTVKPATQKKGCACPGSRQTPNHAVWGSKRLVSAQVISFSTNVRRLSFPMKVLKPSIGMSYTMSFNSNWIPGSFGFGFHPFMFRVGLSAAVRFCRRGDARLPRFCFSILRYLHRRCCRILLRGKSFLLLELVAWLFR